jgi:hypothetical protein
MAVEGEKDTDSSAADNAPAAALTDDQLERQLAPPRATPLSTRARRRRGPLFRALRASPTSSLLFAGASPLMRCVDDSRSLPRCLVPPLRGGARRLRPTTQPRAGGTRYTAQRPPRSQRPQAGCARCARVLPFRGAPAG